MTRVRALNALTSVKGKLTSSLMGHGESEQRSFCANDVGKAKPLRFSGKILKTLVKIVPVNDVNSVCRVCFVGICPGAAGSPCKCEKIVNVKHNLFKPSKD